MERQEIPTRMETGWCRGRGLVRDVGTLLPARLQELQGTMAPQVQHAGCSARLQLVDQSRLMPGSHQAVSAQRRACASRLCLPVGQVISHKMLRPLPG